MVCVECKENADHVESQARKALKVLMDPKATLEFLVRRVLVAYLDHAVNQVTKALSDPWVYKVMMVKMDLGVLKDLEDYVAKLDQLALKVTLDKLV